MRGRAPGTCRRYRRGHQRYGDAETQGALGAEYSALINEIIMFFSYNTVILPGLLEVVLLFKYFFINQAI